MAALLRRLLYKVIGGLAMIWVVSTFTFFLIRLMPGDPARGEMETLIQQGVPEEQARLQVADMYGFVPHDPFPVQYGQYLWRLVHFDLGTSTSFSGVKVSHIIMASLPWTLFLVTIAVLLTFVIGIAGGVIAAMKRDSWIGGGITLAGSILHGIPVFVLGLVLVYFLYTLHPIFSSLGPYDPEQVSPGANLPYLGNLAWHAVLPVTAFAISGFGFWALAMKSSVVSTLGDDFILASELRGIKPSIRFRYIARNAFLPLFTVLAITLGYTFGGSIFIERIFVYPGVGKTLLDAVGAQDFALMDVAFLMITVAVIVSNILADLLYTVIDPRIRTG